ncbi:hypothetical protein [Arthrobacter sp. Bz4]|uniref:hypothetical protein n=2 Tax=unclassified Arthrobacter TaxID=235627 RepID=UPI000D513698|nr:hypothetical protein [Arthrobacter sp. Bz4]PVE19261.1 hypothetical protein DDA93_05515 [Arthrobacter sp. Bz4]
MNKNQLALRVQEIIAGVEGVAGLYPARSAVLAGIASTLGANETVVAVDTADTGLVIRARIAALTGAPAPRLVRDVAAAVRAELGGLAGDARAGSVGLAGSVGSAGSAGSAESVESVTSVGPVSSVEITVCGFTDVRFS